MAWWGFPRYVSKAEKQARAANKLERLKKKRDVKPVILQGSAIARSWWGKSWNKNLEAYADYSNRIGRGRSYVRHGAVLDLQIEPGKITALVQGSRSKPYEIVIQIGKLNRKIWQHIATSCSGMLESVSELVSGKFPKELGELFLQRGAGLFPSPKEIDFTCSCPDWASMCKHVAAALYGVGARLDEDATLLFTLRGVDMADLVGKTVSSKADNLLEMASKKSSRVIQDADLSALFGIDLSAGEKQAAIPGEYKRKKQAVRKKSVKANKLRSNPEKMKAKSPKSVRSGTAVKPGTPAKKRRKQI
ncbi:MAG: hypothetical protein OEW15_13070 [Nitrospirota bacterium]|nr:hypothetical protein [Nitrospirota bacterium]